MMTPKNSTRTGTACSTFIHNAGRRCERLAVKGNDTEKTDQFQGQSKSHLFNTAEGILREEHGLKSIGTEVPLYGGNGALDRREDEPYLYNIPPSISPIYRKMPKSLQVGIWSLATLSSRKAWKHGLTQIQIIRTLLKVLFRSLLCSVLVEDFLFSPSRVDTKTMLSKKWLPSELSKFSNVTATIPTLVNPIQENNFTDQLTVGPLGVHFLEYVNKENAAGNCNEQYDFDAIYFNHGFGASSLSWLPAIPSLTERLRAKVSVAHDAPGFGFTTRLPTFGVKNGLVPYSAAGSAALGNTLLLNRIESFDKEGKKEETSASTKQGLKRVGLFGHSMGCAATLHMALSLPQHIEKTIVLVAPALVGSFHTTEDSSNFESKTLEKSRVKTSISWILRLQPVKFRTLVATFISCLRQVVLDFPLMLILRRLVGQPNFWSKGLRLAWGDPDILSKSDALRYKWPSIGTGWEEGLLAFTRSRITSTQSYNGGEIQLLSDVLRLPNVSVIITAGTKDNVIHLKNARKIADHFNDTGKVVFVEFCGRGHNPFEENSLEFVQKIQEAITA